jgi:hypothetical protein
MAQAGFFDFDKAFAALHYAMHRLIPPFARIQIIQRPVALRLLVAAAKQTAIVAASLSATSTPARAQLITRQRAGLTCVKAGLLVGDGANLVAVVAAKFHPDKRVKDGIAYPNVIHV